MHSAESASLQCNKRTEEFYVLAVRTGSEAKYIAGARRFLEGHEGRLIWPRRNLAVRRLGATVETIASLYPGYLFWRTRELSDGAVMALRKGPDFIKFLNGNADIVPLDGRDASLLEDLLAYGEVMRKSTVTFDENRRIRVVDGPLRHLEGHIVKVDRRKKRARVKLNLHGRTMLVDLGFEVLEEGE